MAIYNENYLMETKSQMINNSRNKSGSGYVRTKKDEDGFVWQTHGKEHYYGTGKENYRDIHDGMDKNTKPMRTAADYRAREKWYSTSNTNEDNSKKKRIENRELKKKQIKEACEYILSTLEESEYIDNEY